MKKFIKNIILASLILIPIASVSGKTMTKTSNSNVCKVRSSNYIHYQSSSKSVYICHENKILDTFKASYGSNGLGKTKKGDRKTPTGLYTIQPPRSSSSIWRTFIHIDYPTKSQKEKGYTGGSVGLHGPSQYFPFGNDLINYGAGCIVVADNKSIDLIVNYVVNFDIKYIYIV
tara:strand:+ start:1302 stop:1820 length:519 start_codon:yes stop_codon:yes gene_type:complete